MCRPTGPGEANCTCGDNLGGDGYSCYGHIAYEIQNHPELEHLNLLLQVSALKHTVPHVTEEVGFNKYWHPCI